MKKLLVCILSLCLLVPLLASCEKNDSDASTDDGSKDGEGVISLTTPVVDMEGREFRVLCHDFGYGTTSILGFTGEIIYEEENGSAVDEAKKQVLDHIEAEYNCTVTGERLGDTYAVSDTLQKQVTSGTHEYDIFFDSLGRMAQLATNGLLEDLNHVEGIDLSKPWWDQNAVSDLSINGKNYFISGDINNYDDQGTWCILFNKNLKSMLGIDEDFYQLVKDGEWTFDKLVEICTQNDISTDLTGEGTIDELDRWAFGTETYNIYVHLVGAGQKIAQKDDDDFPFITLSEETDATYTILGDIIEFYNDNDTVMVADGPIYGNKFTHPLNCWEETVHKAFVEGRELFYMCGLINVASFRQMEDEFGILPIPKYYDTQDRYYHTVSVHNSSFMALPLGVTDASQVGTIVSAIAELSGQLVTPAYYDVQLKYRDSRDDESGEMLDIIFDSRTFDLGSAYNWGGILNEYASMDVNVASRFESILSKADTEMERTVEAFE